jgi:hypothetical protein
MARISNSGNNSDVDNESAIEKATRNPIIRWVQLVSPFLKPGGKTVAVILSLGMIYLPLSLKTDANEYVAIILATSASIVAVFSEVK